MATNTVHDITTEVRIVAIDCGACGITFGLGENYHRKRREDHRTFHCPNGCSIGYSGKTEADKLRRRLEFTEQQLEASRSLAQRESHRARAYKGQVTRVRRRVGKGVCPCCSRSFENLARHMENKHPDYADGGT